MKRKPTELGPSFLINSGLLFAINRDVLHPLGLALEVVLDRETGCSSMGSIWDCRDDPEGITYGPTALRHGELKLQNYMRQRGTAAIESRKAALGYVIQRREDDAEA